MSTFIDRLQQVSRSAAEPMGFRAAKSAAARPKLQLVAHFRGATAKSLKALEGTADAVLFNGVKSVPANTIRGVWLTGGSQDEITQAQEAGADFVVLPVTGAALPAEKKTGRVLALGADTTDLLLRAVNDLPVDAVLLVEENAGDITWQRLMLVQRFTAILSRPLLVTLPPTVTAAQLQLLWNAGASGVVVAVAGETEAAALKNLRQAIDGLSYPVRRKTDTAPALPLLSTRQEEPEGDEDD